MLCIFYHNLKEFIGVMLWLKYLPPPDNSLYPWGAYRSFHFVLRAILGGGVIVPILQVRKQI